MINCDYETIAMTATAKAVPMNIPTMNMATIFTIVSFFMPLN